MLQSTHLWWCKEPTTMQSLAEIDLKKIIFYYKNYVCEI